MIIIRTLLLNMFVFLTNTCLTGQILILPQYDSLIIVGPENVDNPNTLFAAKSMELFDEMLMEINDSIASKNKQLDYIQNKNKNKRIFWRKKRHLLKELENEQKYQEDILGFRKLWKDFLVQENLKREFVDDYLAGGCYDLMTSNGIVKSGDYKFNMDTIEIGKYMFKLTIPVFECKTQSWVKKGTGGNCLSKNPEDCYVWCRVTKNHYQIRDFIGEEYTYETCPDNFELSRFNNICFRNISFYNGKPIIQIDIIAGKNLKKQVKLIEWKKVNCDS